MTVSIVENIVVTTATRMMGRDQEPIVAEYRSTSWSEKVVPSALKL